MSQTHDADIVIIGAGIAGLWLHARLRRLGYNSLLLEREAIGCGQTIASQGIIHSGLKYAFAGKINKLAQNISAMPDRWRAALNGVGDIDLRGARMNANSQYMLIPSGFMGGLVKLVTAQTLGKSVRDIPKSEWPEEIKKSGFKGSVIFMGEPVLDIPSVLKTLSEQHQDSIRSLPLSSRAKSRDLTNNQIPPRLSVGRNDKDGVEIHLDDYTIQTQKIIYTAASSNHPAAKQASHDKGLQTQARPLLMGFLKPAPFEFYAHLVGTSEKPVATITTHKMEDGTLVWYLGGAVAEREKEADPQEVINAAKKGFTKYLPKLDLSNVEWSTLPIDRIEGKSNVDGWMPDTPTVHSADNAYYCWPTKLTFAPLLADRIIEKLGEDDVKPSLEKTDWSFLEPATITQNPWDKAKWIKDS